MPRMGSSVEVREPADVCERLAHLALFVLELRLVVDGLPLAAAAALGVRAHRRHAQLGRREELLDARLAVRALALDHPGAHPVAGHGAAHEQHEALVAGHALAAVGQRVDGELEDIAGLGSHAEQCTAPRDCPPPEGWRDRFFAFLSARVASKERGAGRLFASTGTRRRPA